MWCEVQVKSGNDDMRQDAVMQQFFALINNVLQESPDTQKRKLRIVTYKVNGSTAMLAPFCERRTMQYMWSLVIVVCSHVFSM